MLTWNKFPLSVDALTDEQKVLFQRSIHALKFFTFHTSTPSAEVSQLLETSFFTCSSSSNFPLLSSRGVLNCADIRMPDPTLSTFVKNLPVIPQELISDAAPMLALLQSRGLIKTITFDDVLKELNSRPLSSHEMVSCLKWWMQIGSEWKGDRNRLMQVQRTLVNAAILSVTSDKGEEKLMQLSSIQTYLAPKPIIPVEGPLPEHVLPPQVSKELDARKLEAIFGWFELSVVDWLSHLCSLEGTTENTKFDITVSPPWSERVLSVLSRGWQTLPDQAKDRVTTMLKDKACIPTSSGMKTPEQSYFATVNIFQDLPIVTLPSGNNVRGLMERFLQSLGVRKHVELQVLFNRYAI